MPTANDLTGVNALCKDLGNHSEGHQKISQREALTNIRDLPVPSFVQIQDTPFGFVPICGQNGLNLLESLSDRPACHFESRDITFRTNSVCNWPLKKFVGEAT